MEQKRDRSGKTRCFLLAQNDKSIWCRPCLENPEKKCTGKAKKQLHKQKKATILNNLPISSTNEASENIQPTEQRNSDRVRIKPPQHFSNKKFVVKKHEDLQGCVHVWTEDQLIKKQAKESAGATKEFAWCWKKINPQHQIAAVTAAVSASTAASARQSSSRIPCQGEMISNQSVHLLLRDCTIQQFVFMNCKSLLGRMLQRRWVCFTDGLLQLSVQNKVSVNQSFHFHFPPFHFQGDNDNRKRTSGGAQEDLTSLRANFLVRYADLV